MRSTEAKQGKTLLPPMDGGGRSKRPANVKKKGEQRIGLLVKLETKINCLRWRKQRTKRVTETGNTEGSRKKKSQKCKPDRGGK